MLYTLNMYTIFICQLCLNKAGKETVSVVKIY